MESINFTPEAIAVIVGFVLMLVFAYFPKLRLWYAALASEVKSYVMIGLLVLATVVIWVGSFYGLIPTTQPVTWITAVRVIIALLVANQPTYTLLPEAADVKAARLARNARWLLKK